MFRIAYHKRGRRDSAVVLGSYRAVVDRLRLGLCHRVSVRSWLSEHLSSNRLKVDERVAGVSHVIQLTPVRRHDSQSHDVAVRIAVRDLVVDGLKMSTRVAVGAIVAAVRVRIVVHCLHDTLGHCVRQTTACRRTELRSHQSIDLIHAFSSRERPQVLRSNLDGSRCGGRLVAAT